MHHLKVFVLTMLFLRLANMLVPIKICKFWFAISEHQSFPICNSSLCNMAKKYGKNMVEQILKPCFNASMWSWKVNTWRGTRFTSKVATSFNKPYNFKLKSMFDIITNKDWLCKVQFQWHHGL
jgi:hypothetical protein